jgi:hypothetical protein
MYVDPGALSPIVAAVRASVIIRLLRVSVRLPRRRVSPALAVPPPTPPASVAAANPTAAVATAAARHGCVRHQPLRRDPAEPAAPRLVRSECALVAHHHLQRKCIRDFSWVSVSDSVIDGALKMQWAESSPVPGARA